MSFSKIDSSDLPVWFTYCYKNVEIRKREKKFRHNEKGIISYVF